MSVVTVKTTPFANQKSGTAGLRKKTRVFQEPGYLENYVQSIWSGTGGAKGKTFVLGGDGRFFNPQAIQIVLRMAAANGAARIIVGKNGLLSTPAVSHLIRQRGADGGIILSASHHTGGPDGDFGVKYNIANGGPAPENITAAIHAATEEIGVYRIMDTADIDLSLYGIAQIGRTEIEIVDPLADYTALLEEIFDFPAIADLFASGFRMRFDAMHAITGPYAKSIFENRLGAAKGSVINAVPLPDFGQTPPDPHPDQTKALTAEMRTPDGPDFGAASDGDGDRNMIMGRGLFVAPSDSLAVLAANASLVPGYANGLAGVARSMPTSRALDRVAGTLGIACHETPTGWKHFGTLLDAGRVTLCGEESAGTGSGHIREKDGLWAVLFWLNILAVRRWSVADVMAAHWKTYGRNYYARHDYDAIDSGIAHDLMQGLRERLPALPDSIVAGLRVSAADEFAYDDPVDGSRTDGHGIRIDFHGGARMVFRLSDTGTVGTTLRVYLETFDTQDLHRDPQEALANVARAADQLARIAERTGRKRPTRIT